MERMRARGFTPPADGQAAAAHAGARRQGSGTAQQAPGTGLRRARQQPPRRGAAAPRRSTRSSARCRRRRSFGQVWLNVDSKLQRVRLRLGITDGSRPS